MVTALSALCNSKTCKTATLVVALGPEGGLDSSEVALLEMSGFSPVSLGQNILRAETAAIVAIADEGLLDHATELGNFMRERLRNQLANVAGVVQVRGQGLIVGVELSVPCVELVKKALEKKLLINVTSDKVIRLLPAFVMRRNEAEQVVDITCSLIGEFLNS